MARAHREALNEKGRSFRPGRPKRNCTTREEEALVNHNYETMKICVEAYLAYVREIDTTLTRIAEDIARLEAHLELIGVSFETVGPSSGGRDKMPDGVARAAELRDEWEGTMARHADELAEAKRLCRPTAKSRYVLWLHEVDGFTWDVVGHMVGYSARQAQRKAETGIRELYGLMPERWRRDPIPNAAPL